MKTTEAAKILKMSLLDLHGWILSGNCPFGVVTRKAEKRGGRNRYYINEERLRLWLQGKI